MAAPACQPVGLMKFLVAALFFIWVSDVYAQAPKTYAITGIAADDTLTIRSGPGMTFPVVARLANGTSGIQIRGESVMNGSDDWVPISFPSGKGWTRSKYLTEKVRPAEKYSTQLLEALTTKEPKEKQVQVPVAPAPNSPKRRWKEGYRDLTTAELRPLIGVWKAPGFGATVTVAHDGSVMTDNERSWEKLTYFNEGRPHLQWAHLPPSRVEEIVRDQKTGKTVMITREERNQVELEKISSTAPASVAPLPTSPPNFRNSVPCDSQNSETWGSMWESDYALQVNNFKTSDGLIVTVFGPVKTGRDDLYAQVAIPRSELSSIIQILKSLHAAVLQNVKAQKIDSQIGKTVLVKKALKFYELEKAINGTLEERISCFGWSEAGNSAHGGVDFEIGGDAIFSLQLENAPALIGLFEKALQELADLPKSQQAQLLVKSAEYVHNDIGTWRKIEYLDDAILLNPQDPKPYSLLAESFDSINNDVFTNAEAIEGMISNASKAIELNRESNPRIYSIRAKVHIHQGDPESAIRDLEEAIRLSKIADPSPNATGDDRSSESHYREVYVRKLADAYASKGDYSRAIATYAPIAERPSGNGEETPMDFYRLRYELQEGFDRFPLLTPKQDSTGAAQLQKIVLNENPVIVGSRHYDGFRFVASNSAEESLVLRYKMPTASSQMLRIFSKTGIIRGGRAFTVKKDDLNLSAFRGFVRGIEYLIYMELTDKKPTEWSIGLKFANVSDSNGKFSKENLENALSGK